jgi:hypothetical protein
VPGYIPERRAFDNRHILILPEALDDPGKPSPRHCTRFGFHFDPDPEERQHQLIRNGSLRHYSIRIDAIVSIKRSLLTAIHIVAAQLAIGQKDLLENFERGCALRGWIFLQRRGEQSQCRHP